MNNRQRLIELIAEYGLDRREVATLLRVKKDTVDHWLLSNESRTQEPMPDMAIELLELKLGAPPSLPAAGHEHDETEHL